MAEIDGASTATAESADYQYLWRLLAVVFEDSGVYGFADDFYEAAFVGEVRYGLQRFTVYDLLRPVEKCERGTGVAGMIAEGGDAAPGGILQEFEIVKSTAAAGEAGEGPFEACLLLVAVCELDVCVVEGEVVFVGEL